MNLVFISRNFRGCWGCWICKEQYNALTKTGNVSLDSIIIGILINAPIVIRFSVGGD